MAIGRNGTHCKIISTIAILNCAGDTSIICPPAPPAPAFIETLDELPNFALSFRLASRVDLDRSISCGGLSAVAGAVMVIAPAVAFPVEAKPAELGPDAAAFMPSPAPELPI